MTEEKKNRQFVKRLKDKYRFVVYNDTTFEEMFQFRLSQLNVFAALGFSIILIAVIVIILIAFTPLKEFLPQYEASGLQREFVENAMRVDSIEQELKLRDQYFQTIKTIIEGKVPDNYMTEHDTTLSYENVTFEKSTQDSILREQVEMEEQYNLTLIDDYEPDKRYNELNFFAPINNGLINNKFDLLNEHYGVDIVAAPNTGVLAVLDGTITMATWTLSTGYVIQVQHTDNFVSTYKHNAALLKKEGDKVKAGETIAIIGNSGELTTGPHLHFELWKNGEPVDPENYITF